MACSNALPGTVNNIVLFPGDPKGLCHLEEDIGETTDVSLRYPEVVARLEKLAEASRVDLGDGMDRQGKNVREAGYVPVHPKNSVLLIPTGLTVTCVMRLILLSWQHECHKNPSNKPPPCACLRW